MGGKPMPRIYRHHQFWCSVIFFFFLSPVALLGVDSGEQDRGKILAMLSEGEALADQGKFAAAVSVLNRARTLLDQSEKPNELLRNKLEQALRITKGRAIVARYNIQPIPPVEIPSPASSLRPKSEEPKELQVKQVFGAVLLRGIFQPRSLTKSGETFAFGRRVTVSSKSGVDLDLPGKADFNLRAVDAGSFTLPTPGVLDAHSGAYLLRANEDDGKIRVEAPFAEVEVSGDDPFAVMIGITTNGGLKMIGLLGEVELRRSGQKLQKLRPGQLVFVLPKGYSRKMYVELSTLIATADLLTAFEEPPPYYKRLKTEALVQALRTKRRFRTVVGDVKGTNSFEMKVLREDEKK
jgi:hypothetical protein